MLFSNLPKGKDGVRISDHFHKFIPLEVAADHTVFTCTNTSTSPAFKMVWFYSRRKGPIPTKSNSVDPPYLPELFVGEHSLTGATRQVALSLLTSQQANQALQQMSASSGLLVY